MSHISTVRPSQPIVDRDLLLQALKPLGKVTFNDRIKVIDHHGVTRETYDIVLTEGQHSLGLSLNQYGYYEFYYDKFSTLGKWCETKTSLIVDNYLSLHYQQKLAENGYTFSVDTLPNGAIEINAQEQQWA